MGKLTGYMKIFVNCEDSRLIFCTENVTDNELEFAENLIAHHNETKYN